MNPGLSYTSSFSVLEGLLIKVIWQQSEYFESRNS